MSSQLDVLVVGAGVAGLAAGRALTAVGHRVQVVERRTQLTDAGMALNLPGNAVRALMSIEGSYAVLASGRAVERREYRDPGGRLLFAVDEGSFWRGIAPSVSIRRDVLVQRLAATQQVALGTTVLGVRNDGATVAVEMASGRTESYDLVVGADGVGSSVRQAIGGRSASPSRMTGTAWRFLTTNPGIDCWTAWTGSGEVMLAVPLPGDELYVYAARTRGGHVGEHREWVARAFGAFRGMPAELLSSLTAPGTVAHRGGVDEIRSQAWVDGRVALLGDAAHATGPVWAEGAGMAFEDALVLAEELDASDDVGLALDAWEQRRRPRVAHVQSATDRMSALARLPGLVQRLALPVTGPKNFHHAYRPLLEEP